MIASISAFVLLAVNNVWFLVAMAIFLFLILAILFNFFSIFLDFLHAQGCFAVVIIALIGLPGLFILCLAAGYNITSTILLALCVVGAITGYMVKGTEGNVGKFGNFMMIISIITLLIALITGKIIHPF